MNFDGKVILITGASSGIGAGAAEYFAKFNAKLALVGRNEINLNVVIEKCRAAGVTDNPLAILADVTEKAEEIITKTITHFGKLDILINNAGILYSNGTIEKATLEQYDKMMDTNVRAVFELTKFAVPHLIQSKGNIINVSSFAGHRCIENAIIYCMSKAALDQFTKCMSLDLASKGVRVNSVNPGVIITDIHLRMGLDRETYEKFLDHNKTIHPLGRVGVVADVVTVIAFLASEELSGFMTGALLPICGGKINACPR